ncbi:MAG TPA: short-chain dehydrogenase [Lentisphaeria bacterium]|nr:MAG: short-chain dehydrogenase [Lentisphaerae bacterium GWF2_38_69]HBM17091.1 short-chain dehydrogenase [Lentisphaeria bacterium]
MDLGLKGKKILILGSSGGLGYAIAKAYSQEGAICAIVSRDSVRAEKASLEIDNSIPFVCDLNEVSAGRKLVETVIREIGQIDILVTNAGGPPKCNFMDLKDEDWDTAYKGLWRSAIDAIKAVAPQMIERKWGRIILSTSTSSKEIIPSLALSNAYRFGLMGIMKTVSLELAPHNITVNAILPGFTKTKRLIELGVNETEVAKTIPMGRLGLPEEFAALAVFLGSEKASYITGQAIACDGGKMKCV